MEKIKLTKKFKERLKELGSSYDARCIDLEMCGYRKINKNYSIEISGLNNNKKNIDCCIYVWKECEKRPIIVDRIIDIKSMEQLKNKLSEIVSKYRKGVK